MKKYTITLIKKHGDDVQVLTVMNTNLENVKRYAFKHRMFDCIEIFNDKDKALGVWLMRDGRWRPVKNLFPKRKE